MSAMVALRRSLLAIAHDARVISEQLADMDYLAGGPLLDATALDDGVGAGAGAAVDDVGGGGLAVPPAQNAASVRDTDVGGGVRYSRALVQLKTVLGAEAASFRRLAGRAQLVLGRRWASLDDAAPGVLTTAAATRVVDDAGSLVALAGAAAAITAWGAAATELDEPLLLAYLTAPLPVRVRGGGCRGGGGGRGVGVVAWLSERPLASLAVAAAAAVGVAVLCKRLMCVHRPRARRCHTSMQPEYAHAHHQTHEHAHHT